MWQTVTTRYTTPVSSTPTRTRRRPLRGPFLLLQWKQARAQLAVAPWHWACRIVFPRTSFLGPGAHPGSPRARRGYHSPGARGGGARNIRQCGSTNDSGVSTRAGHRKHRYHYAHVARPSHTTIAATQSPSCKLKPLIWIQFVQTVASLVPTRLRLLVTGLASKLFPQLASSLGPFLKYSHPGTQF